MKRIFFILVVLFLVFSCKDKEVAQEGSAPGGHMEFDFSPYMPLPELKDGVYLGEISEGLDGATVEITVEDGILVQAEIKDILAFGWRQDAVNPHYGEHLVEAQTLDLDAVSGATGSLHAFKIAAALALEQALPE